MGKVIKPRISRHRNGWQCINYYNGHEQMLGLGNTPADAFNNWHENFYGLVKSIDKFMGTFRK